MKTPNILVPINLAKCPLEIFSWINTFGSDCTVTMLHVINLNLFAPPANLIHELCREAERRLESLERKFLDPEVNSRVCVRAEGLAEGILAEAKKIEAGLIVLTSRSKPPLKRFFLNCLSNPLVRVLQDAPCAVGVIPAKTTVDFTQDLNREIIPPPLCEIIMLRKERLATSSAPTSPKNNSLSVLPPAFPGLCEF